MRIKTFVLIPLILSMPIILLGQKKTLAERLGYPATAKLLIIHADDMGLSHSTNMAVINDFKKMLKDNNVTLITWRQIRDLMRKEMDK